MNKKKANLCTALLAIVLFALYFGSWFVKTEDEMVRLSYIVSYCMSLWFMTACLEKFRNWLMK